MHFSETYHPASPWKLSLRLARVVASFTATISRINVSRTVLWKRSKDASLPSTTSDNVMLTFNTDVDHYVLTFNAYEAHVAALCGDMMMWINDLYFLCLCLPYSEFILQRNPCYIIWMHTLHPVLRSYKLTHLQYYRKTANTILPLNLHLKKYIACD